MKRGRGSSGRELPGNSRFAAAPATASNVSDRILSIMASIRFDDFEIDIETQQLARRGAVIASGGKAVQLLAALVESRGRLVTRDELRQRLWSDDVFVDFDANLNAAARRLRALLGDSADAPRFIETLPGRGYRFKASIAEEAPLHRMTPVRWTPRSRIFGMCAVVVLAAIAALAIPRGRTPRLAIEIDGSDPGQDVAVARVLNEELAAELGLVYPSALAVVQAGEPDADFRLRGLIATKDDRLRISLRLLDAGTQVWADVYACDLRNIDSIRRKAVQELGAALDLPRHQRLRADASAVDPEAYRLYAAARRDLAQGRLEAAESSLRAALEKHPAHAPSLAALAEVLLARSARSAAPLEALRESQLRAIEALRIDYTLARAHSALGWARFRQGARQAAERDLRRAVRLDPSDRTAVQRLAQLTGS